MLNALRLLREDLKEKARWCYQSDGPAALAKTLATDGTSAMVIYRLQQGARELHLAPVEMVFNKLNNLLNTCVIGRGTDFGPGFASSSTRTASSSTARCAADPTSTSSTK